MSTSLIANHYENQLIDMESKQDNNHSINQSINHPLQSVFNQSISQLKSLPAFHHATATSPTNQSDYQPSRTALPSYPSNHLTMINPQPSNTSPNHSSNRSKPTRKRASTTKKTSKRPRSEMGEDDGEDQYEEDQDTEDESQPKLEEHQRQSIPQSLQQSIIDQQSQRQEAEPQPVLPISNVDMSQVSHMPQMSQMPQITSLDDQPNSHLINPLPPLNFPVHNHSFVASAGFIVERPDKNNITRRYVHYRCAFCGKDTNDKSRHSKHELACSRGAAKSSNKPPKKAKTRQPDVRSNTIIYPSRPPMMMDANGMLSGVVHQPLAAPLTQQPALPPSSLVPTLPPVASTLSFEPTLAPEHNGSEQQTAMNGNHSNQNNG